MLIKWYMTNKLRGWEDRKKWGMRERQGQGEKWQGKGEAAGAMNWEGGCGAGTEGRESWGQDGSERQAKGGGAEALLFLHSLPRRVNLSSLLPYLIAKSLPTSIFAYPFVCTGKEAMKAEGEKSKGKGEGGLFQQKAFKPFGFINPVQGQSGH